MLIPLFWQTGFRLLKTGLERFKPVFGFSNLHKNILLLYKANNFMYYASAGEPMACVPKVARETIFRGTRGGP